VDRITATERRLVPSAPATLWALLTYRTLYDLIGKEEK